MDTGLHSETNILRPRISSWLSFFFFFFVGFEKKRTKQMKSNWKIRDQFPTLFLLAFVKWIELLEIESTNTQAHSKHQSSCRSWADHVHDHERVHHHDHHDDDDDDDGVWVHFNSQNWGNLSAKKYEFCRLFENNNNNNNHNKKELVLNDARDAAVRLWRSCALGPGCDGVYRLKSLVQIAHNTRRANLAELRRC